MRVACSQQSRATSQSIKKQGARVGYALQGLPRRSCFVARSTSTYCNASPGKGAWMELPCKFQKQSVGSRTAMRKIQSQSPTSDPFCGEEATTRILLVIINLQPTTSTQHRYISISYFPLMCLDEIPKQRLLPLQSRGNPVLGNGKAQHQWHKISQ